ncbi:hypothetical protein Tco_0475765 [Tanacetum coccineum]
MTTLADKSLLSGGDNKPPMLEKHLYDSWKSRMELYMLNRPHGRMILASVEKGPLVWPSITEDGVTRLKEYIELTPAEAIHITPCVFKFDKPLEQRATVDMLFPNSLSPDQQVELECEVTLEELKRAVWDYGSEKSPGPDGFSFGFYRHFWVSLEMMYQQSSQAFFHGVAEETSPVNVLRLFESRVGLGESTCSGMTTGLVSYVALLGEVSSSVQPRYDYEFWSLLVNLTLGAVGLVIGGVRISGCCLLRKVIE